MSRWRWGDEPVIVALFEPWASKTSFRRASLRFRFDSFDAYLQFQEANFGFLIAAKRRMDPHRYDGMISKIRDLTLAANPSSNGSLCIDNEYLVAIARKKQVRG